MENITSDDSQPFGCTFRVTKHAYFKYLCMSDRVQEQATMKVDGSALIHIHELLFNWHTHHVMAKLCLDNVCICKLEFLNPVTLCFD